MKDNMKKVKDNISLERDISIKMYELKDGTYVYRIDNTSNIPYLPKCMVSTSIESLCDDLNEVISLFKDLRNIE